MKEKKSALKIEGKSVMERVEDFAKLNYLLDYHNIKKPSKKPESDFSIELLEAEAEAELLLLELLEL